MSCISLQHHFPLCSQHSLNAKKNKKNSSISSKPETPVTRVSCVIWLFWPQTGFFWRTWPVTQRGEMLSWWANVCWDAAAQYGQDGSLLEIHVEKISCPSKTASVAALQCWRRKVLSLGKVSWLLSSPRGKAGEAQACCVHLCAYATHGSTSLHRARNVSLPFTLPQWLLLALSSSPYQPWHLVIFLLDCFRYGSAF